MATNTNPSGDHADEIRARLGDDWRAALDRVLTRQMELFGELDALCERQRGLVEAGDTDRLSGLLAERDRVIGHISEGSEAFAPFAELWTRIEGALDETTLRDVRRRVDAIASLAASIAERDEADGASMRERRDELADRLAGNTRSRAATSAYAGPRPSGPRYQDREG